MSIITTHEMIPLATTHLKEDSSDAFLGTETLGSRTEIKKTSNSVDLSVVVG